MRGGGLLCALLLGWGAHGQRPDVRALVARSVQANEADFRAQPQYNYLETDRDGDTPSKTYEVLMIQGTRYHRLVAVNGRPLPPDQQRKEANKLRQAIARRKHESAAEREARIARYRKNRDEERVMLNEMARAFDYTLVGEQKIGPYDTYVLDARPRPDYHPPNMKAKVLTGMRGKMWLDKQDGHWVKVTAEVVQPVYFEGFLARVGPGTRFELEKAPVAPGIWLPTHFSMQVNARILGVFSHNSNQDERYSQYRPVTATALAAASTP